MSIETPTSGRLDGPVDHEWINPPDPDVRFRPGRGGEMTHEWAAYMLNLWWKANSSKLTFADAIKVTTHHFMVEQQP